MSTGTVVAALVACASTWSAELATAQACAVATTAELRTAIGNPSCSTINVAPGTYLLTSSGSGELVIDRGLTIANTGGGRVVIDAGGASRVFFVKDVGEPITLNGLTITGGNVQAQGGGLYVETATVYVFQSTIHGNTAGEGKGGGIFTKKATLELTNSTVSGNSVPIQNEAGGIYQEDGTMTLQNVTLAANSAADQGGGAYIKKGTLLLQNTILADNTQGSGDQLIVDGGTLVSNSHNLVEGGCVGCLPGDLTVDPLLGPLADNGGNSFTHALLAGSPAIDSALDADAPAVDQRDIVRPQGASSDIGAYEVQLRIDLSVSKTDAPDPVPFSDTLTYTVVVTDLASGSDDATNVVMVDTLLANFTLLSATPSQGSCSGTTIITCLLGTIVIGDSATVTIVARPFVTGALSNTAHASGDEVDVNAGNNSATAATTGIPATVRDEFNAISYAGNDGNMDWSTEWLEVGETTSPTSGSIRVVSSSYCATGNCIQFGGDEVSIGGRYVYREANLTGATSAVLSFSYRRRDFEESGGSVLLQVSDDGGNNWVTLETYPFSASDGSHVARSCEISSYISGNTQVRFLGSGGEVDYALYIDDVQIEYSDAAPGVEGCTPPLTFGVDVTPDGADTLKLLPGSGYSYRYTITNTSSGPESFDLLGSLGGGVGSFVTIDSVTGPNVTGGTAGDSARMGDLTASASDSAFVWITVADVAVGSLDSLYLKARSVGDPATSDSGWAFVEVIAPTPPTVSSAGNQTFLVGDPAIAISTITVTDNGAGTITIANDIRIRIPTSFSMTWDTGDVTATIGGGTAGKVSSTVSYEDGGKTLVIDVLTGFVSSDQITISGLSFANFSAPSTLDNLELEVGNDGNVSATDDKTIQIDLPGGLGCVGEGPGPVICRASTEAKAATDVTSLTVPTPAGTAAGDLLIAVVNTDGDQSASLAPPVGQGWQPLSVQFSGGFFGATQGVWWKLAGAGEPANHQFTWSGTEQAYGFMLRFTGHDPATPIDVSGFQTGADATPLAPSVTTAVDNTLVLRVGGFDDDDVTVDAPGLAGHVAITMDLSATGFFGTVSGGAGYFSPKTPAGATGSAAFALTATEEWVAGTIAIRPAINYEVAVTPDGVATLSLLPSNGTGSSYTFTVTNNSDVSEGFDLFGFPAGGGPSFVSVDSITGATVSGGTPPDSARMSSLAVGAAATAVLWFSVGDVAAGSTDSLYLKARSLTDATASDSGWVYVTVIRPDLSITKTVNPNGTQPPATDLTYTIRIGNDGTANAVDVVNVDSLPPEVEFKVGTVTDSLPTGVTVTVEFSNDGGATWTYTPVSQGCSAPVGYDRCVNRIRWTLDTDLSTTPDHQAKLEYVARIR